MLTSTDMSLATFAHHVLGGLVVAEPLERRGPQLTAARPLDELELGDDLRLDEVGRARRCDTRLEWALVSGQRLELCVQVVERPVGEPGSNLARVHELALVVVADEQGARISAPLAFPVEPAADDQLLSVMVLDLLPHAGPPAVLVARVELLR